MGKKGPNRGSRAYWHRKRAPGLVPRIRTWSQHGKGLQGFAGYKAGMAHVVMTEYRDSPSKGQDVAKPVTLLVTPPLFIYAVVAYKMTPYGWKVVGEVPAVNAPKQVARTRPVAKKTQKKLDDYKDADAFRVIAVTLPHKVGLKKTPEVMEIALGGSKDEAFQYAASVLGKEVPVKDVFNAGELLDAISVTKGHGWQGVVKRFGVALNPHKATQARRHGGALGGETQAKVMYTIPRAGQTGFHRRTDRNKRIVAVADTAQSYQPKGGFRHFGLAQGACLVLEGSIPGPAKRLVRLRKTFRAHNPVELTVKQVVA
ncbi:50S ribosomal protein L3 [Candidatus Micrarchaeota archaeon]|nr:50S ribosomal protein L3 [Candidatus Micrarchaeota archaeon]